MVAVSRSELPSKGLVHISWKLVVVTPVTVKPVDALGGTEGREVKEKEGGGKGERRERRGRGEKGEGEGSGGKGEGE